MATQVRREHHTVPKLYLRGFCHTKGIAKNMVIARGRTSSDQHLTIKQATVVTDFYSIDGEPDLLEKLIGDSLENPVGPIMVNLRKGTLPNPGADRATLEVFIAFQMVRTVAFRELMIELTHHLAPTLFASDVIQEAVRTNPSLKDGGFDLAQLAKELAPRTPEAYLEASKASIMRNMIREAERLRLLLSKMEWHLSHSVEALLVTGDAPVVVTDSSGTVTNTPQTLPELHEVHVPITPHRLLTITSIPRIGHSQELSATMAQVVNQAIARNCTEYVFRRPDMDWPSSIVISRARSHLPAPAVDVRPSNGPATQMTWPSLDNQILANAMKLLGGDPDL
ncbi:DUF4238 domain-containing protein [Kribbella sp. NPDC056861]|uniref:DUF4238 domain-containing protein n=1 Tax=Kribbella sp. NPDC056861 TaxID=3154857 RepID=UPI0034226B7F